MVGDGKCASDNQAERSSDWTSSRVRWSEDENASFTVRKLEILNQDYQTWLRETDDDDGRLTWSAIRLRQACLWTFSHRLSVSQFR